MSHDSARPGPWRGRRVVLAGIVLVALNLRIAVGAVSPILADVREDVALTDTLTGVLGAVPVASFALFGALAPLVARRVGLEPALIAAMVLSTVGEVVRSTVGTPTAFLGWSVIALAGMGMGNVLLPPLVKRYFPDRIGAVTAVYSVAMAVSASVPPLIAVPLAAQHGWRVSLAAWALLGALAVAPWLVVVVRSAQARAQLEGLLRRGPATTPRLAGRHRGGGRVRRSPLAWGLALTFSVNTTNVYIIFAWLPDLLVAEGMEPAAAGRWLALFAVMGLVPALVAPPLTVRLRDPWWLVLAFVAMFAAGYVGLLVAPTAGIAWWMVLTGIGSGTFPVLLTLLNLRTRTSAGASSLSGFVQGFGYGLAGAGPVLVGLVVGRGGGYDVVLVALLASMLVLLAAARVACRPVLLEDTWAARGHDDRPASPAR
ncbi:MFS transporter [Cellulomonas sp. APG4]|uniref:MFS transporter n=1 Tax=Cellulomonas sp. APG4 TaxID=1538656 RepID=UPI00137B6C9F|nr:MFS transporter [Cellulomonas sp. APG4]NCT91405.1 MFS transporter [Cellulomonas sp. APG4]